MAYAPYTEPANTKMPFKERQYIYKKYHIFVDSKALRDMYIDIYTKRVMEWNHREPIIERGGIDGPTGIGQEPDVHGPKAQDGKPKGSRQNL